ncbi:hypothetical protein RYX36_027342 [Vicia faba]
MCIRCNYLVTTCCNASFALNFLKEIKNLYDVILSEAQMPDMNSYHFLQHVTQQIRIPVIMMCVDQSITPSLVMKAIEKGACGYWIKPLSEGQIKNIWQHVVRKVLKENNQHDQFLEILNVLKKKKGKEVSSQPSISKLKKLFSVIEAVASSRKRVLLPKKNIRNSLQFSSELHRTIHGFIVFEVAWNNVRGINYFNELQTDTSLAIEAKLMKRWEFDNIAQAASCMSSWFSGTLSEQLLLKEHLDSASGEIFYDDSRILLSGDLSERQALVEAEGISSDVSVCDKYLAKTAELLTSKCMTGENVSDPSSLEILKEPFFSAKLLRLIGILTSFRLQHNRKCIIFVNRIVTARSMSYILQQLKLLSQWKVFAVTSEFVATEKHNHSIAV